MDDASIEKLASALRVSASLKSPTADNKVLMLIIGGVVSIFITICGGCAMYFITQNLGKTDATSLAMAGMTNQITSMSNTMTELKSDISQLRTEMANARIDPFTGTDGKKLEDNFDAELDRQNETHRAEMREIMDRLRKVEGRSEF
jgi:predicted  nucleic acid-binding Zn-ribbon protein